MAGAGAGAGWGQPGQVTQVRSPLRPWPPTLNTTNVHSGARRALASSAAPAASAEGQFLIGIVTKGGTARNRGVDFSFSAPVTPRFSLRGHYSCLDARLTSNMADLLQIRNSKDPRFRPKFSKEDMLAGDRLTGSAQHSGPLAANYLLPVADDKDMNCNWTATYIGDILTRVGGRGFGETLPGYVTHRVAITYRKGKAFQLSLFANNIFNKYAMTGASNDRSRFGFVNGGVIPRYCARSVPTPRVVGVEAAFNFCYAPKRRLQRARLLQSPCWPGRLMVLRQIATTSVVVCVA